MNSIDALTSAATRAQLLAKGFADHEIRTAIRSGTLTQLASGILICTSALDGTPEQRHRELASAVFRRSGKTERALADVSAAAVLGLPVWGLDTSHVVFTERSNRPRSRTSSLVKVISDRRPTSTVVHDGITVSSPARVVVDIARSSDRIAAIAVGDAALHNDLCTTTELEDELDLLEGMSGVAAARRVVGSLNGKAESVLETRSRMTFVDAGLPMPELQVDLFNIFGEWIARVDFLWRKHGLVGECDGYKKYNGEDGRDRLLYEKGRSEAITELNYRQIHWKWRDVDPPARLIARITAMLKNVDTNEKPHPSLETASETTVSNER